MVEHGAWLKIVIDNGSYKNTPKQSDSVQEWIQKSQRQSNAVSSLETLLLKEKQYIKSKKDRAQQERKVTPKQEQVVHTEPARDMTGQEETNTPAEPVLEPVDCLSKEATSTMLLQPQTSHKKSGILARLRFRFKVFIPKR